MFNTVLFTQDKLNPEQEGCLFKLSFKYIYFFNYDQKKRILKANLNKAKFGFVIKQLKNGIK